MLRRSPPREQLRRPVPPRPRLRRDPVNPSEPEILGRRSYPDIASIPQDEPVEVVDIFRRADLAGAHVDEAIERGAKAVWMQLGVIDEQAARRALAAGLDVVMDRCPAIELPKLQGRR